jgi:hypothetical protein
VTSSRFLKDIAKKVEIWAYDDKDEVVSISEDDHHDLVTDHLTIRLCKYNLVLDLTNIFNNIKILDISSCYYESFEPKITLP